MPAAPQELAERSLHRLPVPLGEPFVPFGWLPLKDSVDSDNMLFCVNTCAMNTNETALITINAALNLLTNHRSLGREATRLRNMSICSDLVSLVSYLFICLSSLVVLAKLMLYFQPERKFPGRVEPHIVNPRVSPFSRKCWNIVETCTTTDCYAQCLEFVRALPDFLNLVKNDLQTFTTADCEPHSFQ